MKKLFTSLAAMIIVTIMFMGCEEIEKSSMVQITATVSTTDVTTETSVTTSTTKYITTTDTTSSIFTTSTTTTATTVATTEYTEEEETVLVEEEVHRTYNTTNAVAIPVTEEETYYEKIQSNMTINYSINQLTYYSGPEGCKGRWGRTLLNNYSIASNLLPDGTIVHIESSDGSICGDYRVDDTGAMGSNVIDIFYTDCSNIPYPFSRDGRISCTVWVYK